MPKRKAGAAPVNAGKPSAAKKQRFLIESFQDLYGILDKYQIISDDAKELPEILAAIEKFISDSLSQADPQPFIDELNAREQQALKTKKEYHEGGPSLCYWLLREQRFSVEFTKTVLSHLSTATLDQPGPPNGCEIPTPLGFAILKLKDLVDTFDQSSAQKWRDEIIYYLLDHKKVNPDIGRVHRGYSLPAFCVWFNNRATFYPLAKKMIALSNEIDAAGEAFGMTALHFASAAGKLELVQLLLAKQASVVLKGQNELFNPVKYSALMFATQGAINTPAEQKADRLRCIQLLLDQQACPDEYPELCLPNVSLENLPKPILSAYQMAAHSNIPALIDIFRLHPSRKGEEFNTKLHEKEAQRRDRSPLFQKAGEATLELQLGFKAIDNPEHLLSSIYDDFRIRCYVGQLSDRQNVEQALRWLFSDAITPSMPVAPLWDPVRKYFLNETRNNRDLKIFVHTNPALSEKAGCFNSDTMNDIYIQAGLDIGHLIPLLAHEIGHYFAHRHQEAGAPCVPAGFESEFDKDRWVQKNAASVHPFLRLSLEAVDQLYEGHAQKLAEFFTRTCLEFPIRLQYYEPGHTLASFEAVLERSMPNSLHYFKSFTARPRILEPQFEERMGAKMGSSAAAP